MENQVNKILEIKETEPAEEKITRTSDSANNLRIVGNIVLAIGVVAGLFVFFATMMVDSGKYTYSEDLVFNPTSLIYLLTAVIPSVTIWAFSKAVADIVDNTNK